MKIIVSGGCGFIGSHLCEKLIECGHNVLCVDNCATGKMKNIKQLMDNPLFTFVNHNIQHDLTLPDGFIPCQIYHMACPASPKYYQNNSLETLLTNIYGTINMLNIAVKHKARFLLASTSEVYGDPLISPQNEEYWGNVNPVGVRSCYDEGKRVSETLCLEYNRMKKVDVRIARIFNTYGPKLHQEDGRVISNFIIQSINNTNITVYGNGFHTRSFCYISDQINGLIKLMNMNNIDEHPVMIINIGNPQEITINDLANLIIKLTDSKSKIVHMSLPLDDPKKRNPDISKAKHYLNWEPIVHLEDGLIKTIEYFRSEYFRI